VDDPEIVLQKKSSIQDQDNEEFPLRINGMRELMEDCAIKPHNLYIIRMC